MADDLHDFETTAQRNFLERIDELGEIRNRGVRYADADHRSALLPQALGKGIPRIGQFIDGIEHALLSPTADANRAIDDVGYGARGHAGPFGNIQDCRSYGLQCALQHTAGETVVATRGRQCNNTVDLSE
jgi:hypothetical protein